FCHAHVCGRSPNRPGREAGNQDRSDQPGQEAAEASRRVQVAHATTSRRGPFCGLAGAEAFTHEGSLTPRFSNFSRKPGRSPVLASSPTTVRLDEIESTWK